MPTILTARISTLIVGLARGFLSSLRFAESSVCESCGLNISVHAEGGTFGSGLTIDCQPPNASRFSLFVEVTADAKLLISCECSRSGKTKSVRDSGGNVGISCLPGNYVSFAGREIATASHQAILCSRCRENPATWLHRLRDSPNVKPKYPYLCDDCTTAIKVSGETV